VPKIIRLDIPDRNPDVELASEVVGSRARTEILRLLSGRENADFKTLCDELGFVSTSIAKHLVDMETMGVVIADLPPGQRRGRYVRYSIDREQIRRLLNAWSDYIIPEK